MCRTDQPQDVLQQAFERCAIVNMTFDEALAHPVFGRAIRNLADRMMGRPLCHAASKAAAVSVLPAPRKPLPAFDFRRAQANDLDE